MKRIFTLIVVLCIAVLQQANAQNLLLTNACERNPCNALSLCVPTPIAGQVVTNPNAYNTASNPMLPNTTFGACGGTGITGPSTGNWCFYRFRVFQGGTFGFSIAANDPACDLNFALFNTTLSGGCNISSANGVAWNAAPSAGTTTGCLPTGPCTATFETLNGLPLVAGNTYILGICRVGAGGGTAPNMGFSITFSGTAVLQDPNLTTMTSLASLNPCSIKDSIRIKLSNFVRCGNIQNGDFSVTGPSGSPTFTVGGLGCPTTACTPSTGVNYSSLKDTIVIKFPGGLSPGTYTINATAAAGGINSAGCPLGMSLTSPITFVVPDTLKASVSSALNCLTGTFNDTIKAKGGWNSAYCFKPAGALLWICPGSDTFYVANNRNCNQSYIDSVRDFNGCKVSVSTNNPCVNAWNLNVTGVNPPCNGSFALDTIKINTTQVPNPASGLANPYRYVITGPNASLALPNDTIISTSGNSFSNLQWTGTSATYTVTAINKWGCSTSVTRVMTQPDSLKIINPVINNISCNGLSNGSINLCAQGGTNFPLGSNYTWVLDPPPYTFGQGVVACRTYNNLPAGAHKVVVQDFRGCRDSLSFIILMPDTLSIKNNNNPPVSPFPPAAHTTTFQNPTCPNTSGGWIKPYAIGGNGTEATKTYYLLPLVTPPNIYTDSIQAGTGDSFLNLSAGTYTVLAVDALGCSNSVTYSLALPPFPNMTLGSITNPLCFGDSGTVVTNVSGGTGPYLNASYTSNPVIGGSTITASGANGGIGTYAGYPNGTYNFIVTDVNGCKDSITNIQIIQPPVLAWGAISQVNVLCTGNSTGTITATTGGGSSNITYTISPLGPQTQTTANGGTVTFNGLNATAGGTGCYTVTATDINACSITTVVCITQPSAPLAISISSVDSVSCNGGCDGEVELSHTGGTGIVNYTINPLNNPPCGNAVIINNTISNLPNGIYTVIGTDANGCTSTIAVTIFEPNLLTLNALLIDSVSCFGGCDGMANFTPSGGTPPYSYVITGAGSPTYNSTGSTCNASTLCSGNYQIEVTDGNGCDTTINFFMPQPTQLGANLSNQVNVACFGDSTASVQITPFGGTPIYDYIGISATLPTQSAGSLNPTSGANTIATNLSSGTYSLFVRDANLCLDTVLISITQPASPLTIASLSVDSASCFNACDGQIIMASAGGTGVVTYTISPNTNVICGNVVITGNVITNLHAGTYDITGTDVNGCDTTLSITVFEPTSVVITSTVDSNVSCFNGCDGEVSSSSTGGTAPYTYSISPNPNPPCGAAVVTSNIITNLPAGTYVITSTDANGCTGTTSVTITQPATPVSLSITPGTLPSCVPGCDGAATANASGGTPGYTYTIAGSSGGSISSTGAITLVCANVVYTVTITDAEGCTTTATFSMNTASSPIVLTTSVVNDSCFNSCTGSFDVNVQAGAGNIAPISYTSIAGPGSPQINTTTGITTQLCAGTYTVTVTNGVGCTNTATQAITQPTLLSPTITSVTNVSCFGGTNGGAVITLSNGTPPYSYISTVNSSSLVVGSGVTSGANNSILTISGLSSGTYTVNYEDANNCAGDTIITVTQPSSGISFVSATQDSVGCFNGCDGSITANAIGGTGLITYSINPNNNPPCGAAVVTNNVITNLPAGTYTVTASDANGCTTTTVVTVLEPLGITVSLAITDSINCFNGCDGEITVTPSGGSGSFSYSITPNVNVPCGAALITGNVISNLPAGNYIVTTTDAVSSTCPVNTPITITQPTQLSVSVTPGALPSCTPGCDGTAQATSSNGTSPYTYAISGTASISSSGAITNVCAGTLYTVTITDANLCTATTTLSMNTANQPPMLVSNIVNDICFNACTGSALVSSISLATPITYSMTILGPSACGSINATTGIASNLGAGQYQFSISDSNGCTNDTIITITQPTLLSPTITSVTNVSCFGGTNGGAVITLSNGTPPYSYISTVNSSSLVVGSGVTSGANNSILTISGLSSGTYTVNYEDANNCAGDTIITVTQPSSGISFVSATQDSVGCFNGCDGSITANAIGGTGLITYSINPNNNPPCGAAVVTNNVITNLPAGTYTVTASDANGCTTTTVVTVLEPLGITVSLAITDSINCFNGCDGEITVTPSGGSGSFSYSITPNVNVPCGAALITGNVISNLPAGNYIVTTTDANGCSGTTNATISQPINPLLLTLTLGTLPGCGSACDGTASASASGGTLGSGYTYSSTTATINSSTGAITAICASPTAYTIQVTDANGCIDTAVLSMNSATGPVPVILSSTNPLCVNDTNGSITMSIIPNVIYTINPSGGTINGNVITGLQNVAYTITGIDTLTSCSGTATITLGVQAPLTISSASTASASCSTATNGSITMTNNPNITSYSSTSGTVAGNTISGLQPGTYTITGNYGVGCTTTTTATVGTLAPPLISVASSIASSCSTSCNGSLVMTNNTSITGYTISPTPTAVSIIGNNITGLCPGTYTIAGNYGFGCTTTTTVTIGVLPVVPISVVSTLGASCAPGCDGDVVMTNIVSPLMTYTSPSATFTGNTSTNFCAGTHVVTGTYAVTSVGSCTSTTTVTINTLNGPSLVIDSVHAASCQVPCDGQAFVTPSGGTPGILPNPAYTIAVTPTSPNITIVGGVISGLCPNTNYTITVMDGVGCTFAVSTNLGAAIVPTITLGTVTNVQFNPNTSTILALGTVGYSTSGGTGTLSTSITPSPTNLVTLPNFYGGLTAGCYTITVTDTKGCIDTIQFCIGIDSVTILTCNAIATNVTCLGSANGTIVDSVAGGNPPYSYSLNGVVNTPSNLNAWSNLAPGSYTVIVTDAVGATCSDTVNITQPAAIAFGVPVIVKPGCSPNNCNGSITIAAIQPALAPFTYSIQVPSGSTCPTPTQSSPGQFIGLGVGVYTITATSTTSAACTGTTIVNVLPPTPPIIDSVAIINASCFGGCNGQFTVYTTPNSGLSYGISPNPTASSNLISGLCAGNYIIYVKDNVSGCIVSTFDTIKQPTALILDTALSTNILCAGQANGTITVAISGGTPFTTSPPYTFSALSPLAGTNVSPGHWINLPIGTYTVTGTDSKGCTITSSFTITAPPALSWTSVIDTDLVCNNVNTGKIVVVANGGTPSYTFSILPNVGSQFPSGTFNNLSAGNYVITNTDSNGCTLTAAVVITQPTPIVINAPTVVNVLCNGEATGGITITATGGTPSSAPNPYTWNLMPGNIQNNTGVFTGLLATTYTITATDANGCTATSSVTITQPPAIVFTQATGSIIDCFGQPTGTINSNATGGTGLISFGIAPNTFPAAQFPLGTGNYIGLYAGVYTITATDAVGCTRTTAIIVNQNAQVNAITTLIEPICKGEANGKIFVQGTGGVPPYQYSLNSGPFQTDTFRNLVAGNYSIRIQDSKGCTNDITVTLIEPDFVGAIINTIETSCIGSDDGQLIVQGTGGRGGYEYYVKPGLRFNKSGIFKGLSEGTYTIRVLDTSSCVYETIFTINMNPNPMNTSITKNNLTCNGRGNEGTATVNINGGIPPYTYLWNTNPVQTGPTAENLYFGNYKVQIIDANGCMVYDSVRIDEGPCCEAGFIPTAFSPNGDGRNDEFRVLSTAGILTEQLEIRDRWGKRVWSSTTPRLSWDGKIDGKDADVATYYYVLRYKCTLDNKTYLKKGDVMLVR